MVTCFQMPSTPKADWIFEHAEVTREAFAELEEEFTPERLMCRTHEHDIYTIDHLKNILKGPLKVL